MAETPHATLQAITDAARDATAAACAWLLAREGERLRAVATAGGGVGLDNGAGRGLAVGEGSAGYVLASGQPLAIEPRPGDAVTHPLLGQPPQSILAVPCEDEAGVAGVLELLDKSGGPFTFDDVELATLLGAIAGAALGETASQGPAVPHPGELGRRLSRAFEEDPPLYARIGLVLESLLDDD